MITIAKLNEKGGVCKTTLAVHLAAILAQRGHRTLLVDGDSQGHASLASGVEREDGLSHLLNDELEFRDVIRYSANGLYSVIPSSTGTRNLAKFGTLPIVHVRERLAELDGYMDFVIIDTAPSISDLHTAFYLAADYVIFPTECEYYSIQGVIASIEHLTRAQEAGAERGYRVAQALGIVPTKYDVRESVQQENRKFLKESFASLVWSPVRARTAWRQAAQFRELVTDYAPESHAARDAETFADTVLASVGERV